MRLAVYGIVIPFTLTAVAGSAWYVITGQNPLDLLSGMVRTSRIDMPMPPSAGPEKPAASLIRPPTLDKGHGNPAEAVAASAAPPSGEPAGVKQASSRPSGPPPINLPATPAIPSHLPAVQSPEIGAEGAAADPAIPPAGESIAASPTFTKLPSRQDLKPLPDAPLPVLLRNTADGPLPIAADGKEPRKSYARPFAGDGGLPKVAVVVTSLGLARDSTNAAIAKLPPDVSLAFSPYAEGLDAWVKKSRGSGHEVLLDLPLEPSNFPLHDAGPLAVLAEHTPTEAVRHLDTVLGRATSYVGLAAPLRSPVTASDPWGPLLKELRNRGLLFVGDGLVGVPNASMPAAASVTLVADEVPFRASIDAHLARLVAAAKRDGGAVAYVSARPVTFERLLAWLNTLHQQGVTLAPVSAVVRPLP